MDSIKDVFFFIIVIVIPFGYLMLVVGIALNEADEDHRRSREALEKSVGYWLLKAREAKEAKEAKEQNKQSKNK